MVINTLCDSYKELPFHGEPRPLFRIHRKLAPYKISFAITRSKSTDDLIDLAWFLCRDLRAHHISCLFLPTASKFTLEVQWRQYDQMGIPYCVLLNDDSLKNGIVLLRSRETTLKVS